MKIDAALWARLWPLLEQAEQHPAAEREVWLRRLQLEPALEAALRRALAGQAAAAAAQFLQSLPRIVADEQPRRAFMAGARVGAYRLLRPLGEGGMSVVWLAERHDGELRRPVALKLPHAGPGQALLAERMRRERDILAGLEHRHIARLYDVGVTDDGVPFMVLEHVDGENLIAYAARHRLGVAARLALFMQVLQAVAHAHASLVLHRDLKPSNILVGADGEVKLLDFGIARLLSPTASPAGGDLTREGTRVLTPDYAAPEQVAGGALTTATDVYALGVLLFELLTGRRPYSLARGTPAELEEAILAADPMRPSATWRERPPADALAWSSTPRQLRRALAGELDLVVLQALAKRPEQRYAGADALLRDLQAHQAGRPVSAQAERRWVLVRKFVTRHALGVAASAAVLLSLAGGLALALTQAERAQQEAAKANAIKDFLVGLFERSDIEQPDALSKRRQSVQSLLERSASALTDGLAEQPQVRDELMGVVGRLLQNLELGDAALGLRRKREQLLARADAPARARVAAALDLAESEVALGRHEAARGTLEAARALCRPALGEQAVPCLELQARAGSLEMLADRHGPAEALLRPAMDGLMREAPQSAAAADAVFAWGELRGRQGHEAEAAAAYERAMRIREALWGPRSVRLARERYAHAMNLFADGRPDAARQEFARALQIVSDALGAEHPATARIELQLGRLQRRLNGEGEARLRHGAEVLLAQAGRIDPELVLEAHVTLIEGLLVAGRLQEAQQAVARALEMPALATLNDGVLQGYRAQLLSTLGRHAQAIELQQAQRARLVANRAPDDPQIAEADALLGQLLLNAGDADGASAAYGRARSAAGLAAAAMARGDFAAALPALQSRHDALMRLPPADRYRGPLTVAASELAQALAGLGRHEAARVLFEQALAASASAGELSPRRMVIHARLALTLQALGEVAAARHQLALALQTWHAQPELGEHLRAPVEAARRRLGGAPEAGMADAGAPSRSAR